MSGSLGAHYAPFSAFKDYAHGGGTSIRQTRKYLFDLNILYLFID